MVNDFSYEIKEHIATISSNAAGTYTVELNLISYNGAPAKLDLRKWDKQANRMQRGLTLNDTEAKALKDALNSLDWLA